MNTTQPTHSGESFASWREYSQKKRAANRADSAALLTRAGVPFTSHNNGAHLIVTIEATNRHIDFWPGTGLWMARRSEAKGRGVKSLIALVNSFKKAANHEHTPTHQDLV